MRIVVAITMRKHRLLRLHLQPDVEQKHIVFSCSILCSLSWFLSRLFALWNDQRILHHLAYIRTHFVSTSLSACLVVINHLRWCFEWADAYFIPPTLRRLPCYNRCIHPIKRHYLVLLCFKWLQLVNRRLIKCKLLIIQHIWIQEFFQLTNSCSIVLFLL